MCWCTQSSVKVSVKDGIYMTKKEFADIVRERNLIFDGAMGTMLQQAGMKTGDNPNLLYFTDPDMVLKIHRQYREAGADVITTNTFGANRLKLKGSGYTPGQVIQKAIEEIRKLSPGYIALDIGPIGQLLEPLGMLSFEDAYDIFKEQILAGAEAGADLLLIETMTDLGELRAALLAAVENCSLPVLCTMSFEKGGRTFTGCSVEAMALAAEPFADAVGINCSLGPEEIFPMAERLVRCTDKPILVQPNAGLPREVNGITVFDVSCRDFTDSMEKIAALGIEILGGCCGTTPEFIKGLTKIKRGIRPVVQRPVCLSSATRVVCLDGVRVIGERINPTGKKRCKEALLKRDFGYITEQALSQAQAGADILDVNVGLPELRESEMMREVVLRLQTAVDLPLQIDSSDPAAIETALRIYHGRAIVNSVNGEKRSLSAILPLVKKYGACVVGLTLDEKGIPDCWEDRVRIAQRIVCRAEEQGIPRERVFIDCLTLTVSAEQKAAGQTLRALSQVKSLLGVKTVLGVSNISFGLPRRDIINESFLTEALAAGLDLPILNPNSEGMMSRVYAHRVLNGEDISCVSYVERYALSQAPQDQSTPVKPTTKKDAEDGNGELFDCVVKGLKDRARAAALRALETKKELQVVDEILIPALDRVGDQYEKGILFLPQLLMAAETVQEAIAVLKERLPADTELHKGRLILATVKGDIHDIGKNIVKIILENYGYQVFDLGRDVPWERIVEETLRQKIKLVGLSALMTTTVKSMEETIAALRKAVPEVKIMVGGAVLTQEYADRIGADFYARDAKASVEIAARVFEN